MLSALLLLIRAAPVEFAAEVGPAGPMIAALGRAVGVPMRAEGGAADETVFVKVNRRPLAETMTAIARATCAEWKTEPNGSDTLSRSAARTQTEIQRETARRVAALEMWRNEYVASLDAPYSPADLGRVVPQMAKVEAILEKGGGTFNEQKRVLARFTRLVHYDPVCRAFARCLRDLDLRSVAALEPQASTVFSSAPNASQRRLGMGASQATASLQSEQLAWGAALRTTPADLLDGHLGTGSNIEFFDDPVFPTSKEAWQRVLPFDKTPRLALVQALCDSENCYLFKLILAGANETPILKLDDDYVWTTPGAFHQVKTRLPDANPSPSTRALFARLKGNVGAIKSLRPFFNDPVGHDFLRIGNQEILSSLAKAKGKSVIACLPDAASATYDEKLSLDQFVGGGSLGEWNVTENSTWIEIRPTSWVSHSRARADRQAVGACLAVLNRKGHIDLASFVRLVAHTGEAQNPAAVFVQLADPDFRPSYASFVIPLQSAFINLYVNLTSTQLARLVKGETISYAELSPAQRDFAARIVYGTRDNVESEGGPPTPAGELDPTFELPNGLLDGAGLRAEFGHDDIAVFHNGQASPGDEFYEQDLSKTPGPIAWSGPPPRIPSGGMANARVDVRRRRNVILRCGLSQGHWEIGHFAEPLPRVLQKPVRLQAAPVGFRKKILATAKALDEMFGPPSRKGGSDGRSR